MPGPGPEDHGKYNREGERSPEGAQEEASLVSKNVFLSPLGCGHGHAGDYSKNSL